AELAERFCAMVEAVARTVGRREPSVGILYPTEMPEDLSMVLLYRQWFEERGWQVALGSPFNLRRFGGGRAGLFNAPCEAFILPYKTDWGRSGGRSGRPSRKFPTPSHLPISSPSCSAASSQANAPW